MRDLDDKQRHIHQEDSSSLHEFPILPRRTGTLMGWGVYQLFDLPERAGRLLRLWRSEPDHMSCLVLS